MAVRDRAGIALRRAFVRVGDAISDYVVAARSGLLPQPLVDLARFDDPSSLARFQITTDTVLGGRSSARFVRKQYTHFACASFEGALDYDDGDPSSRGGFAAVRTTPDEREHHLGAYAALELRVKTDGRPYVLNVKSSKRTPQHLWQTRLVAAPHRWVTLVVPFAEMMLTYRGRVELAHLGQDGFGGGAECGGVAADR